MRYQVKIAILSFFLSFLSVINLSNGKLFKAVDTGEQHAAFSIATEVVKQKANVKSDIQSVNIPDAPKADVVTIAPKTSSSKHYDFTKLTYQNIGVGAVILRDAGNTVGQYRFCNQCKPFLYAHNRANLFGPLKNVKRGDTISVKIDGKIKTYKVINNITIPLSTLNPKEDNEDAAELRASLYKSTYAGKYDITLQTCAGTNDSLRRYIQAVEI